MLDPSKRYVTIVLGLGTLVLLLAIVLGEHMGYHLLGQSTDLNSSVLPTVLITPEPPDAKAGAYGPNWKRSQTLSGAPDPGFPDPRVPPEPLPTRPPAPTPSAAPPTPTPNPNIPIWRRQNPMPTPIPATPTPDAQAAVSPGATSPPSW